MTIGSFNHRCTAPARVSRPVRDLMERRSVLLLWHSGSFRHPFYTPRPPEPCAFPSFLSLQAACPIALHQRVHCTISSKTRSSKDRYPSATGSVRSGSLSEIARFANPPNFAKRPPHNKARPMGKLMARGLRPMQFRDRNSGELRYYIRRTPHVFYPSLTQARRSVHTDMKIWGG